MKEGGGKRMKIIDCSKLNFKLVRSIISTKINLASLKFRGNVLTFKDTKERRV